MTKIMSKEDINTEFNFYHKFLMDRYRRITIRNFNKEFGEHILKGQNGILVDCIKPDGIYRIGNLSDLAKTKGYEQAVEEISKRYPIKYHPSAMCGSFKIFDLSAIDEL